MKINQQTGRVDFGNGLVVDPREGMAEFEKSILQKMNFKKIKNEHRCHFLFNAINIAQVETDFDIRVIYHNDGRISEITFSKTATAEEMSDGRLWYVDYNEGLREEYNKLLQRLLGPQDFWEAISLRPAPGYYDFSWGEIIAVKPSGRSPDTQIEISYK